MPADSTTKNFPGYVFSRLILGIHGPKQSRVCPHCEQIVAGGLKNGAITCSCVGFFEIEVRIAGVLSWETRLGIRYIRVINRAYL